ncbi:MAG: CvpA family protein [Lachnospiraceae bacterium]|nr:CvpA family protein [Lachnospiraceae bacterium]
MTPEIRNLILCVVAALFLIVCVRRGYSNGFAKELRKLISIAVAFICLVLILALRGAFRDRQYGSAIVIAGAIVILSLGWKFVRMVLGLLSGFTELPIVSTLDSLLGAAAGALECAGVIWIIYKIYEVIATQ